MSRRIFLPLLLLVAALPRAMPAAEPHWAYVAPVRAELPQLKNSRTASNAVDRFVLASLDQKSLRPSPPATKEEQLRRVTLDLTGLPPTLVEMDAFLADRSPDAYERVVDRLLASPRFGERMAQDWLDLARFADTHGYHADSHRDMWRWRDWVIAALNANMPLDQFTIEQLAGDLLPNATLSQRIATGFHRNHMVNHENGAIAEEYRIEYVMDRVATTGTVWLGQTWACARCHDHKYDVISQRDFYRMFAYFNNVAENGLDGRDGNAAPQIAAPTAEQQQQLAALEARAKSLTAALQDRAAACDRDLAVWLKQAASKTSRLPPGGAAAHFPLDEVAGDELPDQVIGDRTAKIHGQASFVPGKFGEALLFDGETYVELGDVLAIERDQPLTLSLWMFPTSEEQGTLLARVDDAFSTRGLTLAWEGRKLIARFRNEARTNELELTTQDQMPLRKWQHVAVTYDGSSKAAGVRIFVNAREMPLAVGYDTLTGSIATRRPWQLGRRDKEDPWRGMLDEVRLYMRLLTPDDVSLLAGGDPLGEILATPAEKQTPQQREQIQRYYLEHHDPAYRRLQEQQAAATRQRERLLQLVPTTMVMQELDTPRETFVLERGLYSLPQEKVSPGVPDFVGVPVGVPPLGGPRVGQDRLKAELQQRDRLKAELQQTRLGLARWLVDRRHPLTARVFVNRYWLHFFGRGLVATPEDFGVRGSPPSHPELLDYLAVELMESGWDVKHVLRLMVTSDTYRQSSHGKQSRGSDPENIWLSRGPSVRLSAETIRDRALSASGLLCEQIGGPSVNPHQPTDLWKDLAYDVTTYSAQTFQVGRGSDLYRRSLYTFWKRTAPHPLLAAFDAPNRETCTVERPRTNSPLQALALLNDATMLEAARALARQAVNQGASEAERIDFVFRTALNRRPEKTERERILRLLHEQLQHFTDDPQAAEDLSGSDSPALAAWITVVQVVFNLEEFVLP